MASFYTTDFEFDGKSSQEFNLKIINFDSSGISSGIGSSDVEILSQRVLRKAKPYFLGRIQSTNLEFPLTFGTASPISGMDRDLISAWLFGRNTYLPLYILQDDLNGAMFNCFLTKPEPTYIGNIQYAFKCNVTCDSPFAYSPIKVVTQTFSASAIEYYDFEIYNSSSDDDFLYPVVEFELNTIGDYFKLKNLDDTSGSVAREFIFTGLQASEKITVDNDIQTITSDTGLLRLPLFNKKWFRLLPRQNRLHIESGIGTFTITYRERLKIGG